METVTSIGSAAVVAGYLVALIKMAWPAAPSSALVGIAIAGGVLASFLVALASGVVIDVSGAAQYVLEGIAAAAAAAGLTRTDAAGERARSSESH